MVISFVFIASTREEEHSPAYLSGTQLRLREDVKRILREDSVFQRFLAIRMIFQLGLVAFSYYSVYAFNELHASATQIGLLTGLLFFGEVIINPLFGALGDRKGHWVVLFLGTFVACISAILAGWVVAIPIWFIIFVLAGIANVVAWTTTMVISLGFGSASEQSTYIGLSNTLLAPVTLLSPLLAGWSIEALGYPITFRACALIFLIAAILSLDLLRNGHKSGAQPSS
jgi:MFS family permease